MTDAPTAADPIAPRPLFRDPVFDGAADPIVVWHRAQERWFMLYTNRRTTITDEPGVSWVHGTRIGIATSDDLGASWTYAGTADIALGDARDTHWAPDVVYRDGRYWMFLTFVPGTHADWNAGRRIVRLVSDDLVRWSDPREVPLHSDRVIDASVVALPDGTWRLWYNDERDGKAIRVATSADFETWTDRAKLPIEKPGEGPKVFRWRGRYWMIVDHWHGLGVYHSPDADRWTAQATMILDRPGTGVDDGVVANHADVIVTGDDRAYIVYFTHPGRAGTAGATTGAAGLPGDGLAERRSVIQIAQLSIVDGQLRCDRDAPCRVRLTPPIDGRDA